MCDSTLGMYVNRTVDNNDCIFKQFLTMWRWFLATNSTLGIYLKTNDWIKIITINSTITMSYSMHYDTT